MPTSDEDDGFVGLKPSQSEELGETESDENDVKVFLSLTIFSID